MLGRKGGELTALPQVVATLDAAGKRARSARPVDLIQDVSSNRLRAPARRSWPDEGPRARIGRASISPCRAARRGFGRAHPVTRVIERDHRHLARARLQRGGTVPKPRPNSTTSGAELSHRPSGDRRARHARPGRRPEGTPAPHPHIAGADPHPCRLFAAASHRRPRPRLPARSVRRVAAPVFNQIEGFAVDEGICFVDFKATLAPFARRFFSPMTRVRFRPSLSVHRASAEMDVQCQICGRRRLRRVQRDRRMEILGSGMVHPRSWRTANSMRSTTPASPWEWARTDRDAAVWNSRHPAALRRRRQVSGTVRRRQDDDVSRRLARDLSWAAAQGQTSPTGLGAPGAPPMPSCRSIRICATSWSARCRVEQHPNADRLHSARSTRLRRGAAWWSAARPVHRDVATRSLPLAHTLRAPSSSSAANPRRGIRGHALFRQ